MKFLYRCVLLVVIFYSCSPGEKPVSKEKLKERINDNLIAQRYERVLLTCDSLISLEPNNAWAYIRKAAAHYYLNNYDSAEVVLAAAYKIDSISHEYYFWKGNIKKSQGDSLRAIEYYSRGLLLEPRAYVMLNNRATLYQQLGMTDSALKDFKVLVKGDSASNLAWCNLGSVYTSLKQFDSAVRCFKRAIELEQNSRSYYGRGLAYHNLLKYDSAVADYSSAILFDPQNSMALFYRGLAYAELGEKNQTCEDLYQAWQLGNAEAGRYYELNCHKY